MPPRARANRRRHPAHILLCTLYVQRVLGHSPAEAGLAFPPFNLSVVVGSLIGPRLTEKIGERAAMVSGLLAIAVGVLLLARIPPAGGHYGHLLPSFVLMGAGLGCASVASTTSGTSAAEDEKQGLVSGLLNAAAQVGTALGLAVLIPSPPPESTPSPVYRWGPRSSKGSGWASSAPPSSPLSGRSLLTS